jgi:uncharacterized membrane protein
MATATPELRPLLQTIMKGLSSVGRAGIGLLIVSGPLLIWLKYGGFEGVSVWFWVKMVLVLGLLGGVIFGGIMMKRAMSGDVAAAKRGPLIGMANTGLFLLIVLSAVLAFD